MVRIAFILSLVILCYSCESVVELDAAYTEPTISASSIFTSEITPSIFSPRFTPDEKSNRFEVQLTQSRAVTSDEDFITIEDALVEIYDENGFLESLEFKPNALPAARYEGIQTAEAGKQYALKVSHPDFPTLTANSTIPYPASIGSTTPIAKTGEPSFYPDFSIEKIELEIELNDPPEKNYYHILFSNNLVLYNVLGLDTVLLWQTANNYAPANFDLDAANEEYAILSNPNNSLQLYGAFLDDKDFKGSNKLLRFTIEYLLNPSFEIAENIKVEVRTVSKEYYDFHTSAIQNMDTGSNPLSNDPVDISSNIENGFGLFAGYSSKVKSIKVPR